ncbi:MAG TPA: hypothetical protein VGH94_09795 [Acidimicrobiales bacterium]|jgi:hypothetical protein
MLEVTVGGSSASLLGELADRGLVVKLETFDKAHHGQHWHLGFERRPGVLEMTDLGDACLLKVASNRDGGWATALVEELSRTRPVDR